MRWDRVRNLFARLLRSPATPVIHEDLPVYLLYGEALGRYAGGHGVAVGYAGRSSVARELPAVKGTLDAIPADAAAREVRAQVRAERRHREYFVRGLRCARRRVRGPGTPGSAPPRAAATSSGAAGTSRRDRDGDSWRDADRRSISAPGASSGESGSSLAADAVPLTFLGRGTIQRTRHREGHHRVERPGIRDEVPCLRIE